MHGRWLLRHSEARFLLLPPFPKPKLSRGLQGHVFRPARAKNAGSFFAVEADLGLSNFQTVYCQLPLGVCSELPAKSLALDRLVRDCESPTIEVFVCVKNRHFLLLPAGFRAKKAMAALQCASVYNAYKYSTGFLYPHCGLYWLVAFGKGHKKLMESSPPSNGK